ncbi:hypothetical protein [Uliginosibacterium sp. H1]|uniref:hypothetical protein n=1 Tax=Uliginosibacterium sp. H1 TaxID=3114757 RepID=UPI002E17650C|nr:hypothetical protein [Uliginosibacterium sp. H1]
MMETAIVDNWWPVVLAFMGFLGCMAVVWLTVAGVVHLECWRHRRRRATQRPPARRALSHTRREGSR